MVTPDGERLPVSLTGATASSDSDVAPGSAADDKGKGSPVSGGSTQAASSNAATRKVTGKTAPALAEKEEPLIHEILNKFGNYLDVHEKLEPAAFPKNFTGSSQETSSAPASTAESAGDAEQKMASGGVKTNAVPKSSGPAIQWPEEDQYLIEELLANFGNDLAVHGKLEPSDGFPAKSGSAASAAPSPTHEKPPPSAVSVSEPAKPQPLINFARYTEIRAQLAKFQKAGDQQGYRQFLQNLNENEKLVVPLRNLENKLQKDPSLRAEDELYHRAMQLKTSHEKLSGFRDAMLRYDRIQLLLNDFVNRVKKGPAPLMKAVQSIWSQVRLLLNQVDQLESMRSQMKFLLLGIQDPEIKKKTQEILESLLNRAHSIYTE